MAVQNSALNNQKSNNSEENPIQQDIKIEFIKSDKNKSANNNFTQNSSPEKIKQNIEDINKMKLDYIEKQYIEQRSDDIKLNTDIDLQVLKNQYGKDNQSQNTAESVESTSQEKTEEKGNTNYEPKVILTPEDFYKGRRVLIDAGPTYEKIDDVRFIGNYSSGKMGFALAEEASKLGAEVVLVAGPVHLDTPKNVYRVNVTSADEMHSEVFKYLAEASIIILAAAVADFTPAVKHEGKLKKEITGEKLIIELVKTKDILSDVGKAKTKEQRLIGFALEADNMIENAKSKLERKNCDMIVANKANQVDSGFGGDNNTITLINKENILKEFPPMTKHQCALEILKEITRL